MVISVLLYIFAVLGLEVIQTDPMASTTFNTAVEVNFGDLTKTMVTLLAGLTLDSVSAIYRPIIEEKPILAIYFILFLLVVSIALMNLITALMVESSLQQAAEDSQFKHATELEKRHNQITMLAKVFRQMDADQSGSVSLDELLGASPQVWNQLQEILGQDDPQEIERIFGMLDYDGSGELTIEEFCDGLNQIISGVPLELNCLIKLCKEIRKISVELSRMQTKQPRTVLEIDATI